MADTPQTPTPPAAQPPAAPAQQPPAAAMPPDDTETAARPWDTVGTVLMVGAVAAAAIVLLDIAFKGRILGPVIARLFPQPPPAEAEQQPAADA